LARRRRAARGRRSTQAASGRGGVHRRRRERRHSLYPRLQRRAAGGSGLLPGDRAPGLALQRARGVPALAAIIARERDPGPECASDEAIAAFVRAKGISVYHPVGTCRMGPDADAVVDPELRVRGVSGLRVVASIMPTLVSGNTNAAAILIGEKGGDLILQSAERANWPAGQAAA